MNRTKYSIILFSIMVFVFIVCVPVFEAYAEELPEEQTESSTDSYQNERLNSLEIRLEELGYTINDIQTAIESIQSGMEETEQQRLAISQQLDLLIIAMNDLCNHNIEILGKLDLKEIADTAYTETVTTALQVNEKAMADLNQLVLEQSDITVSGNNSIIDTVEKNIKETSELSLLEFNDTISKTNQLLGYLFVLLIFILVIMLCIILGTLIHNITKKFF